jgi:V/A-type H+/Na+-transporting ATPase subunit E
MNAQAPIEDLENALIARAKALAEEHLTNAKRARDQTLNDATERLRLREEREILAAKAAAERGYRQRVQASEIKLQEELDRVRWALVREVLDALPAELERVAADESRYTALLRALLAQAAQAIDDKALVAELNARDHERLAPRWEAFVRDAKIAKPVALAPDPIASVGGVRVRNADDTVRVDNTFEGRLDRLHESLYQLVTERLFAAATHRGAMFGG